MLMIVAIIILLVVTVCVAAFFDLYLHTLEYKSYKYYFYLFVQYSFIVVLLIFFAIVYWKMINYIGSLLSLFTPIKKRIKSLILSRNYYDKKDYKKLSKYF